MMITCLRVGLLLLLLTGHFSAGQNSDSPFATFKGLEGKWAIQSSGKTLPIEMIYEVGSNGSIVTEQFGKELSVIYREGESLLMTHFCNRGNQPRLRLKRDGRPGIYQFEMFDITNLTDADAPHVEGITYRVINEKKVELEIIWKIGKSGESEKYTLTRI